MLHYGKVCLVGLCVLSLMVAGCKQSATTDPVVSDTNISDSLDVGVTNLDFGEALTSLPVEITVPTVTDRWTVSRARASAWLSLDVETGTGSRQITVFIDRSKLPSGNSIVRDTLIIRGLRRPLGNVKSKMGEILADTAKKIAVSASNSTQQQKAQNFIQTLQQQVSTMISGFQLPTQIDTSISFVGTFAQTSVSGTTSYSALGAFVVGTSVLANVGSSIQLTGRTNGSAVNLAQRGFSYTSSKTNTTISGYIYAPSALIIPARNITFDGSALHTFAVPAGSTYAGFTDNVTSALAPALTSAPSTISQSQNVTLSWMPTGAADDSIFVSLVLTQDSIPRVVPMLVSDNIGSLTISSTTLKTLLGGKTGQATLGIMRFRYKIVRGTTPRGLLSEAQRQYTVTVTQ